jgi:hypothetical protein
MDSTTSTGTNRAIDLFRARLTGIVTNRDDRLRAACPVCKRGKVLTVSYSEREPGKLLVHCFRECKTGEILDTLDLPWSALWDRGVTKRTPTEGSVPSTSFVLRETKYVLVTDALATAAVQGATPRRLRLKPDARPDDHLLAGRLAPAFAVTDRVLITVRDAIRVMGLDPADDSEFQRGYRAFVRLIRDKTIAVDETLPSVGNYEHGARIFVAGRLEQSSSTKAGLPGDVPVEDGLEPLEAVVSDEAVPGDEGVVVDGAAPRGGEDERAVAAQDPAVSGDCSVAGGSTGLGLGNRPGSSHAASVSSAGDVSDEWPPLEPDGDLR